jgi:hypothetical protein
MQRDSRHFFLVLLFSVPSLALAKVPTLEFSPLHHSDMRLSTEAGHQEGRGLFLATQFRYGLHDLLDRKGDYPHATSIEFFSVKWRVHIENSRPWLDELTLLRVLRIPTLSENSNELSWNVDVGLRTVRERFCSNCLAGHVRGGIGVTEAPIRGFPLEIYLLADAEISVAPGASDPIQPAVGPRLGLRLWWEGNWKTITELRYRYFFLASAPSALEASTALRYYLGWDMAVEGRVAKFADGWEYAAGLYVYF